MMWLDVDVALSAVPVNILALTDDTDFKSREESVVFDQAGLDLVWNFLTTAGVNTQTVVTPTEAAGDYDWTNKGNGMYAIEIPASGGGTINNDAEGYGWFSGIATGILHWTGPAFGFRDAALNNALIDGGDNLQVDLTHIMNTILTEGAGGRLAAAFIKLLDVATPTLVASDVMRGTDSANTATPPTAVQNRTEMDDNSTKLAAILVDTGTTLPALIAALDPAASSTINAQGNVGDYKEDATVAIKWDTKGVAPTSPGEIRIYFNGGTDEITVPTGVTDTRAFDGLTGVNHLSIDLSANDNYRKERDFAAVLVGMVIGGQTVNVVLGTWSVEKRNQGEGFRKDS